MSDSIYAVLTAMIWLCCMEPKGAEKDRRPKKTQALDMCHSLINW